MTAEEDKKKAELRKKIEFQVACEEKAFRIVERLIENPVEQEWFIDSLRFVTPNHYHDVIEERAVSKLCGYPLCPKPLGKVPSQKYFISTKSNKVYDIEERKNFCSGRCFKASKYVEKQVSTVPVWSRKNEPRKKIELLPLDMKVGKLGDEVPISSIDDMRTEVKKLEKMDHYQRSLEKVMENIQPIKKDPKEPVDLTDAEAPGAPGSECVYTLDKALSEIGITEDDIDIDKTSGRTEDKSNIDSVKYKTVDKFAEVPTVRQRHTEIDDRSVDQRVDDRGDSAVVSDGDGSERKRWEKSVKNKSNKSSQQAKTDYLMKLLDKKKSVLVKMADIQPVSMEIDTQEHGNTKIKTEDTDDDISQPNDQGDRTDKDPSAVKNDSVNVSLIGRVNVDNEKVKVERSAIEEVSVKLAEEPPASVKLVEEPPASVKLVEEPPVSVKSVKEPAKLASKKKQETVDYLKSRKDGVKEGSIEKSKYAKQYRALVAKVDAQEREFSALIGEESLLEDELEDDRPSAPAPHFEVLRQEMAENQLKVREFMKGSFTYRPDKVEAPKAEKKQREIVLPTVDKYDQILIRQRIVLERINRVLPDLLIPLHLPVGDVFSDIRELAQTFNLTSENILFRPPEWTIVTLILLKMLTKKQREWSEAFTFPSAERYLHALLTGIKTDVETLDQQVDMLIS